MKRVIYNRRFLAIIGLIFPLLVFSFTFSFANAGLNAVDDRTGTVENDPVTIDVLANDSGVGVTPITVNISRDPRNGTVSINPDNTITYTPDQGFYGTDS
ncbi:cadherin-like domain-containing protein, partial [Candidatus Bipolaricaulota bacterium]|nr:cadherin-like domain-containing protein [Candidatus Bipolaricaulota bacterium]